MSFLLSFLFFVGNPCRLLIFNYLNHFIISFKPIYFLVIFFVIRYYLFEHLIKYFWLTKKKEKKLSEKLK